MSQPPSSSRLSFLPTYQGLSKTRLQSLYADIARQKHSNPTSYQFNIEWWRRTLETILSKGWLSDRLVLHANPSFGETFRYEGVGKPLSLSTVIAELSNSKACIPLNYFLTATQSIYDPEPLPWRVASWLVGKPLWWVLQQVGIVDSEDPGSESDAQRWKKYRGDYVFLSLLEEVGDAVIARQRDIGGLAPSDALYNVETFKKQFSSSLPNFELSELDFRVLIKYLERDKRVLVTEKDIIKFVEDDTPETLQITSVDRGILELKLAVENMQRQVDGLQKKITERTEKISSALQQKQKSIAMTHLRSRKQLEETLLKRLGSLETLQSTLLTVETAAGDVEIMKSYESSTATLRTVLSHPSLQRDKVDETMDAMAEARADARDIDDIVRSGTDMAQADLGIDDDELEKELQALAESAEKEREDMKRVDEKHRSREQREAREQAEQAEQKVEEPQQKPVASPITA